MKYIIISVLLFSSCATTRWRPNKQVQATLISAEYIGGNRYHLRLVAKGMDTIHYYERVHSPWRKRFYIAGWYTIQWDTTMCQSCDNNKYVPAKLKLNQ